MQSNRIWIDVTVTFVSANGPIKYKPVELVQEFGDHQLVTDVVATDEKGNATIRGWFCDPSGSWQMVAPYISVE